MHQVMASIGASVDLEFKWSGENRQPGEFVSGPFMDKHWIIYRELLASINGSTHTGRAAFATNAEGITGENLDIDAGFLQ